MSTRALRIGTRASALALWQARHVEALLRSHPGAPPVELVRSLFNRPDLPPIRLHASASLATVIHMAIEGLGIAVIPTAIVENEMADGRLQLLSTDQPMPKLTFSASWLASPDTVAVERVAELAAKLAQGSVVIDAAPLARH